MSDTKNTLNVLISCIQIEKVTYLEDSKIALNSFRIAALVLCCSLYGYDCRKSTRRQSIQSVDNKIEHGFQSPQKRL